MITTPSTVVNLRSEPRLTAAIIGKVPNFGVVICHRDAQDEKGTWWRQITLDGTTGWVMLQVQSGQFTVNFQSIVENPPTEIIVRPGNAAQIAAMYTNLADAHDAQALTLRQQAEQQQKLAAGYRQTAKLYGEE